MMKKSLFFLALTLSLTSLAQDRGRSPAVMDGSCNLEKLTTYTVIVNGKSVKQKRPTEEIEKEELCAEITKCMYSADDDLMLELKSLKAVACDNASASVTPKVPTTVQDKSFDGKRAPSKVAEEASSVSIPQKKQETPR